MELHELINKVDSDGNGEIDFDEFKELYAILLENKPKNQPAEGPAAELEKVVLMRPNIQTSWGMAIADKDGSHLITKVVGGGIADGQLDVGDIIRKVEGKDASLLNLAALKQLVNLSKKLVLMIEHGEAEAAIQGDIAVKLTKPDSSTGLGMGIGLNGLNHHAISMLAPGGIAANSGRIAIGAVIKSINGTDVYDSRLSHEAVMDLIKKALEVRLVLGPAPRQKSSMHLVELSRIKLSESFGCEFGPEGYGSPTFIVTEVEQPGPASGQVEAGDVLIKCNGRRVGFDTLGVITGCLKLELVVERVALFE